MTMLANWSGRYRSRYWHRGGFGRLFLCALNGRKL